MSRVPGLLRLTGGPSDRRAILADFGLCKLWKKSMGSGEELEMRSLTGLTGSLRYMAPEVALSQPYNHKAEVFSFTSLLYHLLASQKPFAWMTPEVFLAEAPPHNADTSRPLRCNTSPHAPLPLQPCPTAIHPYTLLSPCDLLCARGVPRLQALPFRQGVAGAGARDHRGGLEGGSGCPTRV